MSVEPPGQGLVVNLKTPPLLYSWARVMPPVITVDGRPLPTPQRGRNVIPVVPGQHRVHVHIRYGYPSRMGPADHDVTVPAGHWVELEYKAPLWTLGRGSLGPPPQSYNGLVPILALLAVSLIFAVLIVILTV